MAILIINLQLNLLLLLLCYTNNMLSSKQMMMPATLRSPHVGNFPKCEDYTIHHQEAFLFKPNKVSLVLPSLCHTGKRKRKFLKQKYHLYFCHP